MRTRAALAAPLLAALAASAVAAPAPEPDSEPTPGPSIHQLELARHRDEPLRPRIVPEPARLRAGARKSVTRVVYGYYPYWVHDLTAIRWEALTHLAWFAMEIDAQGQIVASHGWPDTDTVAAAHAAGVRVDLTFTLFSGTDIRTLCTDPARRAATITTMIDQMQLGGADGISVDFEGLIDGTRDAFTTFIVELRAGLDARGLTAAGISIAGPEVNWAGPDGIPEIDLPALLDAADYYFIMGYGYFWGGSSHAGPIGILRLSPTWRAVQSFTMLRTLASFASAVGPAKRRQILHGVPYYGREWITTDGSAAASVVSHVGAVSYSNAVTDLAGGQTRRWDAEIANPWYAWQTGGAWHQVYYDDVESLAAKYQLVLDEDLGGMGMWALNYDSPHQELWDLLETSFGAEPPTPPGHRANPLPIAAFPFHDERDTSQAPGSYFNYYSCEPATPEYGREWVYAVDVCQPGTLTARVPQYPFVDPDLHLLSAPAEDACLARGNTEIVQALAPGRTLLVVDTWVNDLITTEGPYTLDVDFAADPGTVGCAADQVCGAGTCVCADPALAACPDACADLGTDPLHCGACDVACASEETCVAGACVPAALDGDGGGCSCHAGARRGPGGRSAAWPLVILGSLAALSLSRRLDGGRWCRSGSRRTGWRRRRADCR